MPLNPVPKDYQASILNLMGELVNWRCGKALSYNINPDRSRSRECRLPDDRTNRRTYVKMEGRGIYWDTGKVRSVSIFLRGCYTCKTRTCAYSKSIRESKLTRDGLTALPLHDHFVRCVYLCIVRHSDQNRKIPSSSVPESKLDPPSLSLLLSKLSETRTHIGCSPSTAFAVNQSLHPIVAPVFNFAACVLLSAGALLLFIHLPTRTFSYLLDRQHSYATTTSTYP